MNSASSSNPGAQNRQKRVLPSRSRRGGPGVGTCDVDILILETLKRRSENEPLIPANTSFILTTNSKYASDDPGGAITINMVANDRYFDRPDVVKAFREQAIIQTPEFSSIGESSNVGGRFRPRAAEDDGAETSDATYEKRHRKFETFEKRQRLREKEKLKHEHYKMKERLDQLRAMDGTAFMTLPASSFSPTPKEAVVDPAVIAAASSPYTNLNGHPPHAEGERRRKEMLDVATMLEERYRILLPPDRVRKAPEPVLSESARIQVQSRDGDDSETDQASVTGGKLRLRLPARSSTSTTPAPSPAATTPTIKKPRFSASSKQSSVIRILRPAAVTTPSPPSPTLPHAEASPLSPSPTIDMDIPSSPEPEPEPEELEHTPSSPLPTAAAVETPTISNEAPIVEPSIPGVLFSNGAAKAQQNYTFTEQTRLFTPSDEEMPLSPDQEMPVTPPAQEMTAIPDQAITPPAQEMPATPLDQEMLIVSDEQERFPTPSDQERPIIPEPEVSTLQSQGKLIHDQEMLSTPLEQERLISPEPERRPTSPEPESFINRDRERESPTPPEQEKLISPEPERPPAAPEPVSFITRDQERESPTPPAQERLSTPEPERPVSPEPESFITLDQEVTFAPPEQERLSTLEPEQPPVLPEPESFITRDQEEVSLAPPEQERLSTPEPERPPALPERESSITQDQKRMSSLPAPDRLFTPVEREESTSPEQLAPLRDRSVALEQEQEKLPSALEERPVTPERLPTLPERGRTTTPEPERLPTPPLPERPTTPIVEVTGQVIQDRLPEAEPPIRRSIEPSMAGDEEPEKAGREDKMSVRAESELPAQQNEPEKEEEVDVEWVADKMDVVEDVVEEDEIVAPIPTAAVIKQAAVADVTMDAIPDATLVEEIILPDVPMTQASTDPGPSVIKQADFPISEMDLNLVQPVPEQRQRTESVDIEKMPSPMPISSISAPRGRGRKKARLDPSIQPNESASAPVRGPRVPKNHVTYIGASGEVEVTASAIVKAAVHRTQRDVTRHLNAFGVPVPNAIVQMGPPFELPEWVFPPLSPAESEHEHGDFDAIEDLDLDSETPSERQQADLAASIEADHQENMEVNPDATERAASLELDPVGPIVQPTRQPGPKIVIPRLPLPPPESVTYEEDTVSLGDEDT